MSTLKIGTGLVVALMFAAAACGDDDEGGRPSCAQLCARIEAPDCPNAAPSCTAACEDDIAATPSACQGELDALSSCFSTATFSCDPQGVPEAAGCKDELESWLSCRAEQPADGDGDGDEDGDDADGDNGGDGNTADGGDGDGEQNLCAAEPGDDSCDACVKDACCAEVSACGPACQAIVDCVQFCEDDPCIESCVEQNLAGAQEASALFTCLGTSCATSCGAEEPSDPPAELCLQVEVPDGYCDNTGLPFAHDCPNGQPYENCVLSPTGAANVYCCDQ